ncbi:MAG TPA: tRNA methyl transferase PRC-barrel domain-containing protein, partial [Patescibacteria group bacterium]|nr:tRNA methyl transferase PRC-barrel domain-containing protein [Patescibacteria group bacterium]
GKDKNKDQSYFLYRLNQAQLSWVIFPLGEMSKDDVKKISKKNKLPNNKNESQEVCFLTDDNYRNFLKRHLPKKYFQSGVIVDKNGKKIGRHGGLINYTIGQRKGINQTGFRDDNKQPLYVIGFNAEKNELIVGQDKDLLKKEVIVENISWVSDWAKKKALANKNLKARIRYRHNPASCKLRLSSGKLKISFSISQRAIVPGQSLVIYCGQEVLGGGIIVK